MAFSVKTCEGCNLQFENKPGKNGRVYHAKKYCSRQCWLKRYNVAGADHSKKGASVAANVWRARRGESHGGNAYVKQDQRHQHRVVAEQILGRALAAGEVVHHEDRNKKNNDPHNLIVFKSQGDHVRHHAYCYDNPCRCDCINLGQEVMPK